MSDRVWAKRWRSTAAACADAYGLDELCLLAADGFRDALDEVLRALCRSTRPEIGLGRGTGKAWRVDGLIV